MPSLIDELVSTLAYDAQDIRRLADVLYARKETVYENTLRDLAKRYGRDPGRIKLSASIRVSLREEADDHALLIVESYNRDLEGFLHRHSDRSVEELLGMVGEWAEERADSHADLIAVTETYSPHADATLNFFIENDLFPEFDFGGHGDDAPVCDICQVLVRTNPHPLSAVLLIATPHIQCRQNWHPRFAKADLPSVLSLGQGPVAGIVGEGNLVQRMGGRDEAVEFIEGLY